MNRLLLAMLLLAVAHLHASAQHLRARTNEQQQISISTFAPATTAAQPRSGEDGYEQLPGFPMAFVASKANKNFRNVTLADLDDDGAEEIIVAIANNLYLIDETGVVWKKGVAGIGIYPPSIADIDQDGSLDIIQVTGGIQQVGGIYIVDKDGNDLPGWPISINDNWILNSPAIADVDDDGSLEIIVNELSNPRGKVHLLKSDGSSYSDNWPALLDNTSAVTPSVGDVDNDGQKEIVFCSTRSIYVMELDGLPATGWPVQNPNTKFSFQSPVLVDFEDDGFMEIIGTAHGDLPEYYVFNHDGSYRNGWPVVIPDTSWSFSPPALYRDGSENFIFTSRPIFLPQDTMVTDDMFYAFDSTGQLQPGFPIQQQDGCEG
ncbi:MAG: VCBS repeat-containing protein, partial [Bacteroidota bacterium]